MTEPVQNFSAASEDALAAAIAAKVREPAFVEFRERMPKLNEVGLLPIIKRRPTSVSDWIVVLPSGREIIIGNDEWKAAVIPDVAQAGQVTKEEIASLLAEFFAGKQWLRNQAADAILARIAAQPPAAPRNAAGNRYASAEEAERAINGAYALADRLSGKPAAPVETATKSAPEGSAPHNSGERLPSSDAADTGADTQCSAESAGEPFMMLSCREAKRCLHDVPGCICDGDPTNG